MNLGNFSRLLDSSGMSAIESGQDISKNFQGDPNAEAEEEADAENVN